MTKDHWQDQGIFHAASLWTIISAVLASILALTAVDIARPMLIGWVSIHVLLAVAALVLSAMTKRATPKWFQLRPAHAIVFLSVTAWGFGVLLLSVDGTAEQNVPIYLVASGLACASIWLLQSEALLMAAAQVCLLLPMLYRLLITGQKIGVVTALLFSVLVIANAFISRRVALSQADAFGAAGTGPTGTGPTGADFAPARTDALAQQESQFQTERMAEQLKHELARHQNIEEELKAAKQVAEAASMAKGEFLATMSHEIRTPLNGIIPLLEILRDSKLQPDQRDYLNTAYSSSKQLLNIIDDILDYSKIEANKLELESTGMNLREVLDSVIRLMERPASAKNLRLSAKLDPGVRMAMRGDPTRLRQVLTNLVSNAIKFTEKGGIQVDIQKRSETRTHQELVFAVKDSGVGISVEAQGKLFKAFQQADTSTTRVFGGTGLGLVICQRIVTLMGGQIGVKSEPGKGSVFWFSVPMLKAQGDIGSARRDVNGTRTLLVSSDQRMVQRFSALLGKQGLSLTVTAGTTDAMGKLKSSATLGENWAFELVVLDANALRTTLPQFVRSALREVSLERLRFVLVQSGEPISADALDPKRCGSVMLNSAEAEVLQLMNRLLEVQTGGEQQFSLLADAARFSSDHQTPKRRPVERACAAGGRQPCQSRGRFEGGWKNWRKRRMG
jgi:signal transduction histidine kinase